MYDNIHSRKRNLPRPRCVKLLHRPHGKSTHTRIHARTHARTHTHRSMISIHRYSQWYINCKQINLRIHGCFPFKNKCRGAINFKATHPKPPPVLVVGARDSRVLRGMSDDVYYATTHWNISAMFHRECLFPDVSGDTSTAVVMFCVWHAKKTKVPRINTYMLTSVLEARAPFANMV